MGIWNPICSLVWFYMGICLRGEGAQRSLQFGKIPQDVVAGNEGGEDDASGLESNSKG